MEVDFNKLVEGNKKQQYWVEKLKIKRNSRFQFLADLKNNKFDGFKSGDVKKIKKDLDSILYGFEVEDFLIRKYKNAVFMVMRNMHIKNETYREDCFCIGLASIRSSIFNYMVASKSFTTYVINGINCFIRGYLHRIREAESVVEQVLTDEIEERVPFYNSFDIYDIDSIQTIEDLCRVCNLNEEQSFLLCLYVNKINRDEWHKPYCDKYYKKNGSKYSRQAIYDKLAFIKLKVYKNLEEIMGEEFSKNYNLVN